MFFWSIQLDDLLQHERWRCVLVGEMGGRLLGHRTPYGDRIKLTTFNSSNSIVDEHMFPYNPYSYFYITYRTLNKLKVWAFWLPSPPKGCYRFDILPSLFHPFSSIFYGLPTAAPTITYWGKRCCDSVSWCSRGRRRPPSHSEPGGPWHGVRCGSIGLKVEFFLGNFPGKREVKDEFKLY